MQCCLPDPVLFPRHRSHPKAERPGYTLTICLVAMILVLITASHGVVEAGVRPAPPEGAKWALLVAVDRYVDDRIPAMTGREELALRTAEVLVLRYGFETDRMIVLTGQDATNREVRREIRGLGERARPGDTIVVIFGLLSSDSGSDGRQTYIMPFDGNPEDPWSMISAAEMVTSIGDLPFTSSLVVFDGCASQWDPNVRGYRGFEGQQMQQQDKGSVTYDLGREFESREFLTTCDFTKWLQPDQVEGIILEWLEEPVRPGEPRTVAELRRTIQSTIEGKVELTRYGPGDGYQFLVTGVENDDLEIVLDGDMSEDERTAAIDRLTRAAGMDTGAAATAFNLQVTEALAGLVWNADEPTTLRQHATLALASFATDRRLEILIGLARSDLSIGLRYTALRAIGLLPRDQSVEGYEAILNTGDPRMVSSSIRSLVSLGSSGSVIRLGELLDSSSDTDVLTATIAALEVLAGDDFDLGGRMLEIALRNDVDPKVVVAAVDTLANRADQSSLPLFVDLAASSPIADVRATAVFLLGDFEPSPESIRVMMDALDDGHPAVREGAAFALGRVKEPTALGPLVEHLGDPEEAVQTAAANALGELGNRQAIPALLRAARTDPPSTRAAAIASLGRLGAVEAFSDLVRATTIEPNRAVRSEATLALERILEETRFRGAVAEPALTDGSPEVRAAALDWLGRARDPVWMPVFHEALGDDDRQVRAVASKGLSLLGTSEAVNTLDRGLASDNADTRHRAMMSLGSSTSPAALEALLRYRPREEDERTYLRALADSSDIRAAERAMEFVESSRPSVALAAADTLRQQSLARLELGDTEGALHLGNMALDIHLKFLGSTHPDVAGDLNNLGVMYQAIEDWDAAIKALERALRIREKVFGTSDPAVATTLSNLGAVYVRSNRPEESLEYLQRSLEIREFAYGREAPETSGTLREIADALEQMGQFDRAEEYRSIADSAAAKTYSRRSGEVIKK